MVLGKDEHMSLKMIGAVIVLIACGGCGMGLAWQHRREMDTLRELAGKLDYMECELQYRLTPLPQLCKQAAKESEGILRTVFDQLATELEDQISPDVESCMNAAVGRCDALPHSVFRCLQALGSSMGRFDLNGQLKGLESIRAMCRMELDKLQKNADTRIRSYQTLGLCAGAALVILFM